VRLQLTLAVLAAILIAFGLVWQFLPRLVDEPMLIVARRGDLGAWPENTLEGIVAAATKGADGIEFDLHRSADGTWYLFHDRRVDSRTDGIGDITRMRDTEIDALTITGGLGFTGQTGLHVPRLNDVLDALGGYDGVLLLDVKMPGVTDHAEIARLVKDRRLNALIACYTSDAAVAVKAVDAAIGTYMPGANPSWGVRASGVDAHLVNVTFLRWPEILAWPSGSLYVVVPEREIVDESAMIDRAYRWGATMFLTNRLDAAIAWRGSTVIQRR
jgi:glycerophosphoryl diester phosphodiesterase